jgi:hypothetical protein
MKTGGGTLKGALAGLSALMSTQSFAASIDIRDCLLENTTFVDWLDAISFSVKRVGTAYSHLCDDGKEPPDPSCEGPYGELVVEGELRTGRSAEPETLYAIWAVYKSVPCCGWRLSRPGENDPQSWDGFTWLAAGTGPKLRDQAFYTIGSDEKPVFDRVMFAVSCEIP